MNGAAQIGRAIPWKVTAPGADIAETMKQFVGVDRSGVDGRRHGCKVLARDRRDLLGDRCQGQFVCNNVPV